MAFTNPNFANREVANLILVEYANKKPFLFCDFANATATGFTATRVFAKGGWGAPNRVQFDGEKAGTLTITTQIMPAKLFSLLTGSDLQKAGKYLKREKLVAADDGLTLHNIPQNGTVQVFAAEDDGGVEIETTVAEKVVSGEGLTAGESYVVYYYVELGEEDGAQIIKMKSDTFPKAFAIYGELPMKNENDEICKTKLVYYKAAPQANFNMSFANSGDPTSLEIVFDIMADSEGNVYDMIFVDDEE